LSGDPPKARTNLAGLHRKGPDLAGLAATRRRPATDDAPGGGRDQAL